MALAALWRFWLVRAGDGSVPAGRSRMHASLCSCSVASSASRMSEDSAALASH